jgi:hypothetical protein
MGSISGRIRWGVFCALTVFLYAVLAGVAQSVAIVVLQVWHQEIHDGARAIQVLSPLMAASFALFLLAGRIMARAMPAQGSEIRYALLTLGAICSLVPVSTMPYDLASVAAVRCGLAALSSGLMFTGARQPILPNAVRRRNAPE